MSQIHCHFCGGRIADPAKIEHRPPRASAQFARPHHDPCSCATPIVYEHPPMLGDPDDDQTPEGGHIAEDDPAAGSEHGAP